MAEGRATRVGQNEALYRRVNEQIEQVNEAFGTITGDFVIVCECGTLDCMEQIPVSREVYERTRANPTRFILKPGHEAPEVEETVDGDGEYVIVEKSVPEARRAARETDPRS